MSNANVITRTLAADILCRIVVDGEIETAGKVTAKTAAAAARKATAWFADAMIDPSQIEKTDIGHGCVVWVFRTSERS